MDYAQTVYGYAKANGYSASQVEGATLRQIATICKITAKPFPEDFFPVTIRNQVAAKLREEEIEARDAARKADIEAKVKSFVEWSGASIERVKAGERVEVEGPAFIVRRDD